MKLTQNMELEDVVEMMMMDMGLRYCEGCQGVCASTELHNDYCPDCLAEARAIGESDEQDYQSWMEQRGEN